MAHLPANPKRPVDPWDALFLWTRICRVQCEHLHDALDAYVTVPETGDLRRLRAALFDVYGASFFVTSAASHVVALLDGEPLLGKLPHGLHGQVRTVRNVLEHWDEWPIDKRSAMKFRESHPGVWPYRPNLQADDFLIGGVISFLDLERAITDLDLWLHSPSPSRIYPPITQPSYPYPLEDR